MQKYLSKNMLKTEERFSHHKHIELRTVIENKNWYKKSYIPN